MGSEPGKTECGSEDRRQGRKTIQGVNERVMAMGPQGSIPLGTFGRPHRTTVRKLEAGLCTQSPVYDSWRALPRFIHYYPGPSQAGLSTFLQLEQSLQLPGLVVGSELQNGEWEGTWVGC